MSGSIVSNTTITGSLVASGETLTVTTGGVANFTTISNGGTDIVINGGVVNSSDVVSGGWETVASGGLAVGSVLDSGNQDITQGGTANATQVDAGGIMTTSSSGFADGATIASTGIDYVLSGGSVTATTVQGGGSEIMFGGTASGTILDPDGTQEIEASGAVAIATVDNGLEYVLDGGVVIGATVGSGGFDLVESAGTVSETIVKAGGSEFVENGGTALSTTIQNGGAQLINAGGAATDSLLLTGGKLDITGLAYITGGTASVDGTGVAPDTKNGTDVIATSTALCFLAGTRIATPRGEAAIEALVPGDMVRCANGSLRPISWVGRGRALATPFRRNAATPVIVRKNALADGVPYDDLRVTKGHSFYFDDVLIPIEFLVNHRSIQWDDRAQEVTLYHIELETHDILLANGAPAESYRDDGNRWLFQNANGGWDLPPQQPCVPVLTGGPLVDTIWRRLLDRTGPRPGVPLTDDPDLHLVADGVRLDPINCLPDQSVFLPTRSPADLRVVSRAAIPQELGIARDSRQLGVALKRIVIRQNARQRIIEAADPRLWEGYHDFEPDSQIRWTDGNAAIPVGILGGWEGARFLTLQLCGTTKYLEGHRQVSMSSAEVAAYPVSSQWLACAVSSKDRP